MKHCLISLIAAMDEARGIGKDNKLLWRIPEDLKRFKALTQSHPIIMGRKTFESIGKPLLRRMNIVLSRNPYMQEPGFYRNPESPCLFVLDFDRALAVAKEYEKGKENAEIFIIGGAQIYTQALPLADKLYLTFVAGTYNADAFFPPFEDLFQEVSKEERFDATHTYTFSEWRKK